MLFFIFSCKNLQYTEMESTFSTPDKSASTSASPDAVSRIFVISSCSKPPSLSKNLYPFLLNGRWLAVIIIAPSNANSSNTVVINIEGVETSPQSYTFAPAATMPFAAAANRLSAVILESCPIPMRSASGFLPFFSASHLAKPPPIRFPASSVRFTASPATPSHAIPRISLPF